MLMLLFYANGRGLLGDSRAPGAADSRRRFGDDGVDSEERDNRLRRKLMYKQRKEQTEAEAEAELDEKIGDDSIDFLICECGTPMLMRFLHFHEFSHAHEVLLCERQGIAGAF
jgi:hypothetical protein